MFLPADNTSLPYGAENATDLLQVVNFTGLLLLVNILQQACQFHQVTTSLLKPGLLQFVICRFVTTTCNKPVKIINFQQVC